MSMILYRGWAERNGAGKYVERNAFDEAGFRASMAQEGYSVYEVRAIRVVYSL